MEKPTSYRILVIDDNLSIHEDFIKLLKNNSPGSEEMRNLAALFDDDEEEKDFIANYEIDTASQGEEGLALVQKACELKTPYALAFIDVRMPPGWDGIETIERIWKVDPNIETVICTAFSDYSWSKMIKRLGQTDRLLILKKPFENEEIRQLAGALTEKWRLKSIAQRQYEEIQKIAESKTVELKNSYSLLRATLESTNDGILVIQESKVVDYNQKFVDMWRVPHKLIQTGDDNQLIAFVVQQLENPDDFIQKVRDLYFHPDAESYDVLKFKDGRVFERYSKPQYVGKDIVGRVWNFRDVTTRIKLEEQLAHQANHDPLTGLPNRKLLMNRIQMAIANSQRFKKKFAVIFFDLDRFKLINDSLGHSVGDRLLTAVAKRLLSCIRQTDTIGRLGGDEFIAIIEHLDDEQDTIGIIQKLLTAVIEPFYIDNHNLNITTCMGISFYPRDGDTAEILFKNSDIAMYRAKELGRNNFQFYNSNMNLRAEQRLEIESSLRVALDRNEFELHYQPLLNLKTKKISGVEALLRWNHPQKGLVYPGNFITAAEETGLIIPIGEWVLQTACMQNKIWQEQGLPPVSMAVNLSPLQFKRSDIVKIVETVLDETKLEAKYLALEITENLLLEDSLGIRQALEKLRSMGVTLIIDDFGTGYSNLSLVNRFPIDKLKIDRSFIRDFKADSNDRALILAVIAMAKSLKMSVVAEGVEELAQLNFLEENQCDEIQGFHYSKPVPPDNIKKMLEEMMAAAVKS